MNPTTPGRTIYLYLSDMPEGVQNDKPVDDNVMYFESTIECFEDDTCDKFSVFSALKKEEALFMKKTFYDLLEHNDGAYCKNHVLIDALLMYKTYVELVEESAFGNDILESCVDFITNIFRLFRLQSRIVVVVPPSSVNFEQDNLSALLKHLLNQSIIEIV
ncbi:P18 [Trabala vishnou gigantina nucleopolyhedrovirus]|uniref:P18 n=1 Tax=Trabala vishnou gigantina nucleopolyhedrovirus TaxID=2863583 RepID=UPI002481C0E1|nr:P18 [Trabala vishnou gigantina nucleopolyhedrovirus]QYC92748.1 P18 [Trabala vishnou gigantina nucleopolyhedrovirus]